MNGEKAVKITYMSNNETIIYASEELKKYLSAMTPDMNIEVSIDDTADGECKIVLGLLSELGLSADGVLDDTLDDLIDIDIKDGAGYIGGSNPRSVLMGVYTYLKSGGCMWVRPGDDGEYIPKKDMSSHSFTYRKLADYRFRGEVIEGAVTPEEVIDTVIWSPKVGYNAFMLQFISPYNYMRRRYEHRLNPTLEPEMVTEAQMDVYTHDMEMAIKRCGMQLHSLGHGFLLSQFGINSAGGKMGYDAPEEIKPYLALVRGKRDFYQNSAIYTHLCYSNDKARLGAVEFLVSYLKDKPYIDFLHVWLADSFNNTCECENCIKTPSDYYVMMLNELDERLTECGIKTKIVPCLYVDTFFPPETERFNNPDRFIIVLSMQRDHNYPLKPDIMPRECLPVYKRNDYHLKPTCDMILGFREAWREFLNVPVFTFDYDLYSTHYYDPGCFQLARLAWEDIKSYPEMDIMGRLSCQSQRVAFPTALPNAVLGETLVDSKLDFDEYTDRYFAAAYGEDGKTVRQYLERITELFCPEQLRNNESVVAVDTAADKLKTSVGYIGNEDAQKRLSSIPDFVDEFLPVIDRNLNTGDRTHRKSWEILSCHAEFSKRYSRVFTLVSRGMHDEAILAADALEAWLCENERAIAPYFDLYLFVRRLDIIVGRKRSNVY